MKHVLRLFSGILMAVLFSAAAAPHLPMDGATLLKTSIGTSAGLSVVSSLAPKLQGAAFDGVLVELWTGELIEKFRHEHGWLSRIQSQDQYVNNDVIHLVDVGADPDVLINNNAYPISTSGRDDEDIKVSLKKFDTTNTKITRDELYALPYDKEGSAMRQHRRTMEERTSEYGLFSLAPAADSADTPVINTTGSTSKIVSGRKDLVIDDIRRAKQKLDDLKVPKQGRVLILSTDHANGLLLESQAFRDKYYNTRTGEPLNFFGFEIWEDVYNPIYDDSNNKKAWDAASAGTDRSASVYFYSDRAFKARGSVEMFYRDKQTDPENRATVVGFQLYHVVLPKKNKGFGAIVSDASA